MPGSGLRADQAGDRVPGPEHHAGQGREPAARVLRGRGLLGRQEEHEVQVKKEGLIKEILRNT